MSIRRPTGRGALAWAAVVLVVGVAASLLGALTAARLERLDDAESLDRRTAVAQRALTAEVRRYESTVAQLAASLSAQQDLRAGDFRTITAPLTWYSFAGASAAAFVVPVPDEQLAAAQATWRAQGATGLTLRPAGTGMHYFPVFARSLDGVEPDNGLDLSQAAEPSGALEEARRANRVAVSDTYVLLRDREHQVATRGLAFIMAAPVYSPGSETGSASGFRGWLVMALRARGLATDTLNDATQGLVNVSLYAATTTGGEAAAAVVQSGPPASYDAVRRVRVPVAQQEWTLTVQSTQLAERLKSGFVNLDVIIGVGGSAVSLLLAAIAWMLLSARARALRGAESVSQELRHQHNRHERLLGTLSTMGEGVAVLEGSRLVFANEAFATITGYPMAELLGLSSLAVLLAHDEDAEELQRIRRSIGEGGPPELFVFRLRHADGHVVPVESTGVRVVDGGHEQQAFVLRDISDRARWQEELAERTRDLEALNAELAQARDVAAAASRAKTDFLTTMSHEIRTPLNGVLGLTAMLLDTDLDDEQRELAATATRAGESLLAIINDVLDLSKIEAGKITVERRTLELRPLLHDVADTFAAQAAGKQLDLVVDVATACPETISSDPTRLRQILLNLVGNAVKFTAGGYVKIGADVERGRLLLSVSDSGEGISEAAQQRLFAPFEQADVSTTRRFGGTGLGLSISRHLAELLGGDIAVTSAPGHGSTFTVSLPLPTNRAAEPFVTGSRLLDGCRVLLACATPALGEYVERRLRGWGAEVVVGAAPWPLPEPGQIDVAVLDARTPDGPYADRVVALAARTPVVLLTHPGQGGAARAPGCVEVTVPVRPERLRAAVREMTADDGREATPPPVPAQAVPGSAAAGATPRRVLVAEDNPVNQKIAAAMLAKLGHQVDVVGTGREAVAAAQLVGYDVVLMDCQMPEMDGWEATATLRSIPATRTLPVIALTASATTEVREACLRAGMDGYLSKPVRIDELREAIDAVTSARATSR